MEKKRMPDSRSSLARTRAGHLLFLCSPVSPFGLPVCAAGVSNVRAATQQPGVKCGECRERETRWFEKAKK